MSHIFSCPSCGAPLDYDGNDPIIRCPYCKNSVIVPENLHARPSFSSQVSHLSFGSAAGLDKLIVQAQRINDVKNLAQAGQTKEAITLYSEITGADEFSAREAVQKLSSGQAITLTGLNVNEIMSQVQLNAGTIPPASQPPASHSARQISGWLAGVTILLIALVLVSIFVLPNNPEAPQDDVGFASLEWSFGGEGTGPGKFTDTRAIGVAPDGSKIFVANFEGGRIQVFDSQGNFQTQWTIAKEGVINPYIQSMAVGRNGSVYVPVFGKILKFDDLGNPLGVIEYREHRFKDVAIALDGSIVAIANDEDIVWMTADGEIKKVVTDAVSSVSSNPELSSRLALDGAGTVYVLGKLNNAIFIFDHEGRFINRLGSAGSEPGQLLVPEAIALDPSGRIYISSTQGVQVFSNDGRYLDVIKVKHFADGLAFDDQGNLYVTTNQETVEKFNIVE